MQERSLTIWMPSYIQVQHFLRIVDGLPIDEYTSMRDAINNQQGTRQSPADWADPAAWIPERLAGADRELAFRIWRESQGLLNPRHTSGPYALCRKYQLFDRPAGRFAISDAGRRFLADDEQVLGALDDYEGMLVILRAAAENGSAGRADFERRFGEFCRAETTWVAPKSISAGLFYRMKNLQARDLIESAGRAHQITAAGAAYLQRQTQA